jgi:hypothetical protein
MVTIIIQYLTIIYGRHQDLILLFKFPITKRTDFFEIYGQFWDAPPKVSPTLSYTIGRSSEIKSIILVTHRLLNSYNNLCFLVFKAGILTIKMHAMFK